MKEKNRPDTAMVTRLEKLALKEVPYNLALLLEELGDPCALLSLLEAAIRVGGREICEVIALRLAVVICGLSPEDPKGWEFLVSQDWSRPNIPEVVHTAVAQAAQYVLAVTK